MPRVYAHYNGVRIPINGDEAWAARVEDALKLYEYGLLSPTLCQERTGVPERSIARYAKRAGILRSPAEAQRLRAMRDVAGERARAVALVERGLTYAEAGRVLRRSGTFVETACKAFGVEVGTPTESRLRRLYDAPTKAARRRREQARLAGQMFVVDKLSKIEIARRLGISDTAVNHRLRSHHNPYKGLPVTPEGDQRTEP